MNILQINRSMNILQINNVRFAYAEGLNLGEGTAQQGLAEARADIVCMFA